MSWSVRFMGTPAKVVEALEKHSGSLTGQSLAEYDEAKPALITLVAANVGPMVDVAASGHAQFNGDVKTNGNCSVKIDPLYGSFVG